MPVSGSCQARLCPKPHAPWCPAHAPSPCPTPPAPQVASTLGLDAATKDAAAQKIEAALGDAAGLKATLNAQLDKAVGGSGATPAGATPAAEAAPAAAP